MVVGGVLIFGIAEDANKRTTLDHFGVPKRYQIKDWFSKLVANYGLEEYVLYYTIDHQDDPTREFLIVYVPKAPRLKRDPETYEYWIRLMGHDGPCTKRINPDQLNQIFITYDFIEDEVNDLVYGQLRRPIHFSAIPYDAQMLKQRVDLRDFLSDLEREPTESLSRLLDTKDLHYLPTYHTKSEIGRNLTRYEFRNSIMCQCHTYQINKDLRIYSNGMIEFENAAVQHHITDMRRHGKELPIAMLLKDLYYFLFFIKNMYTHFAVSEFEFLLIIPHHSMIRKIGDISHDNQIFLRRILARIKLNCLEIKDEIIHKTFSKIFGEIARCLNFKIVSRQQLIDVLNSRIKTILNTLKENAP